MFSYLLESISGRFPAPTCLPKSIKIPPKIHPRTHSILASIFDRFSIEFSSQFRPPGTSKMSFFHKFLKVFLKIHLSKSTSIFDLIRMPIWFHFCAQNPPKSIQKSIPKRITILIDFGIDFLKFLGSNLDPTWPPRRPKNRPRSPKIAQEAPKTAQGPPRTAPKTLSRRLQDRSGTSQNAQERFLMIFD